MKGKKATSMKRLVTLLMAMLIIPGACFSGTVSSTNKDSSYKMLKNLSVPADQSHAGSVISWGGTLDIDGTLKGSIILFGGRLRLDGQVEEDVIAVAAAVEIGEKAIIKRDLYVISGTLNQHPKSTVKGEYFNLKFDLKKIETTLIPILSGSQTIGFLKAVKIILWLVITLIVFAVIPGKVIKAREIFDKHKMKTFAIGVLSLITILFLFFMFIILSFFIIGLPLLFALVLLYFAVCLFGRTVMFYFIGITFSQRLRRKRITITPALFIVMGAVFYALLKFIPVLGPVLLILMSIFEVGIGVGFLLKKKLRLDAETE
jgi:hypothetical protein